MSKIKFHPYSKEFKDIFKKEKRRIKKLLPEDEVHHIGSTAISEVGGKGIIDILVALYDWGTKEKTVEKLRKLGFKHIHPEENGRIFLSKIGETKYKDIHIHLVKKGGEDYLEKLLFRDFLKINKKEAKKYHELKQKWGKEAKGDRKRYGKLKKSYIENIIISAKEEREVFLKKYLSYLGKKVKVVIDRPLGSKHPDFNLIYAVNYGFLPKTEAFDGDEIDVYVLGIKKPIKSLEGEVIAVIHRFDDDEDKLIVVPEGKEFSEQEIKKLTYFQEKYFKSEIIK